MFLGVFMVISASDLVKRSVPLSSSLFLFFVFFVFIQVHFQAYSWTLLYFCCCHDDWSEALIHSHIVAHYRFLCLGLETSVPLTLFAIFHQHTFYCCLLQLRTFLTWNVCICFAAKYFSVTYTWLCSVSHLTWSGLSFNGSQFCRNLSQLHLPRTCLGDLCLVALSLPSLLALPFRYSILFGSTVYGTLFRCSIPCCLRYASFSLFRHSLVFAGTCF